VHDGRYIFQRDNASIHASSSTRAFLRGLSVTVLGWPALSPDLNPIENLWGMVTRTVYDGGKQYHSVNELEETVRAVWEGITPGTISKLVKSMPDCCSDVLVNRGRKTKY
jgi:transposase